MIVSVEDFNAYCGNQETSAAEVALKTSMIASAEAIVVKYLGYDPSVQDRTDVISGIGSNRLYPYSQGISSITSLAINGDTIAVSSLAISSDKTYITSTDYKPIFRRGIDNIVLRYRSGFADGSNEMHIVETTIKRIASLMLQETNGNIGLTGRSFGDQSRTYINYSNYDKYLRPLDPYVVVRFC